ncbi:MAG TPA: biopolymer transporter ExbD [Opitutales bacterium]|nr:biopolymer transporter ExbD [Opitutales bacterium]
MSRRAIKLEEEKSDINISPMIDMVFILLIFFIVTTVFVDEQGIDADRPQPGASSPDKDKGPITIHVSSNGQVFFDNQEIQMNNIRSNVADKLRDNKVPVIIEVEDKVVSGRMVSVIDEARIGGADKVLVTPVQARHSK